MRATTAGNIGRRAPGHAGILRHFIAPQPKWAPLAHSSAYNRGQHRHAATGPPRSGKRPPAKLKRKATRALQPRAT